MPQNSQLEPVSRNPVLRTEGLTKIFPGSIANDDVSLDIYPGEVHAILGENGAGKSTFVKMLYGVIMPDNGRIYWSGRPVTIHSPREARRLGLSMVQQHMSLIQGFTVMENILLQNPPHRGEPFNASTVRARMSTLCEQFQLRIDLDARIEDLPMGVRQNVDILKALYHDCKLLILDEPTAVLTAKEVDRLFAFIRALRGKGCAVILIAHKISEVMSISDRISVLRDGRLAGSLKSSECEPGTLARLMVGREVSSSGTLARLAPAGDAVARLIATELSEEGAGHEVLKGLDFTLSAGEIFGIAGVDGNGQRRLFDILSGENTRFSGQLEVLGNDPRIMPRNRYLKSGISLVPEDRHHKGLILQMSIAENAVMQSCDHGRFSIGRHFFSPTRWEAFARSAVKDYGIKCGAVRDRISSLSGGNQQKVLLARELSGKPDLLVLANPTRGLDIAAIEAIHRLILDVRENGCAILLISSDLDEVLALSDRIGVLHSGRFTGILDRSAFDVQAIGLMMAGEALS